MSSVEPLIRPGSDRGRGDGDRQPLAPRVAVVASRRNLGRLDEEHDEAAENEQRRDRPLDRVVNHCVVLLRGARKAATFLAILLGAAMLIKLMNLADETLAVRHSPVLVHGNELLSTLRAVCDSPACQRYAWELQTSLDVYHNPCRSLYDFVCSRWRRGTALPSVREMAEVRLRKEALQSVLASNFTQTASPDDISDRVAGLVSSCLRARRDPSELRAFLRDRGVLPHQWRSSPHALLTTLVDLSLNWDIDIWFKVRINMDENASAIVHVGPSNSLEKMTYAFKKIGETRKYKAGVEGAFRILGLLEEEIPAAVVRQMSMEALVVSLVKHAWAVPDTGPLQLRLEIMARTFTPAIPAEAWLDALRAAVPPAVSISEETFVRVDSERVLAALNNLLEFGSRRQDDVAEHIAYRTFVEIGWMVDERNVTTRDRPISFTPARMMNRCLREVERMTGVAWFSMVTASHVEGHFIHDLLTSIIRDSYPSVNIIGPSDVSVQVEALPPPQPSFFAEWVAFRKARFELTSSGLYDILGVDSVVRGFWHPERNLTVEPLFFSYPFFHTQLHPALNYGGAGRLIARAVQGLVSTNTSAKAIEELAVSLALRALRSTLGGHVDAFANSAAVDQLFFMSSCYAVCGAEDTARRACDAPVMKLRDYRSAFGCNTPAARSSRVAPVKFIDFRR
ncbi:hypothetical protein HPB50_012152 [Hyalomma asiaticum]|uniref:Uncharacterized protein n=1 Tax=Hyalomma asiaticum TaxID=266040 RepID=A0ACB7SH95_HYAAI|nr:hypothetical protein HPB50_012152 [Hyalomma asiaticum]